MTAEEKKERRNVRHSLAKAVRKHHFGLDMKATATGAQFRAGVRKVTDQILAGKNPLRPLAIDSVLRPVF